MSDKAKETSIPTRDQLTEGAFRRQAQRDRLSKPPLSDTDIKQAAIAETKKITEMLEKAKKNRKQTHLTPSSSSEPEN